MSFSLYFYVFLYVCKSVLGESSDFRLTKLLWYSCRLLMTQLLQLILQVIASRLFAGHDYFTGLAISISSLC